MAGLLSTLIFGYRTIMSGGAALIQRDTINLIGATAVDNPDQDRTDVIVGAYDVPEVMTDDGAAEADAFVQADTSGGAFTLTLPSAVGLQGRRIAVSLVEDGNTLTIAAPGAETINGDPTYTLTTQWQSVGLVSNGTSWIAV